MWGARPIFKTNDTSTNNANSRPKAFDGEHLEFDLTLYEYMLGIMEPSVQTRVPEVDVNFFSNLPRNLCLELRYHVNSGKREILNSIIIGQILPQTWNETICINSNTPADVLYIDTTREFRLDDMANWLANIYNTNVFAYAGRDKATEDRKGFVEQCLRRIHVLNAPTIFDLHKAIKMIPHYLRMHRQIKLIIIDSFDPISMLPRISNNSHYKRPDKADQEVQKSTQKLYLGMIKNLEAIKQMESVAMILTRGEYHRRSKLVNKLDPEQKKHFATIKNENLHNSFLYTKNSFFDSYPDLDFPRDRHTKLVNLKMALYSTKDLKNEIITTQDDAQKVTTCFVLTRENGDESLTLIYIERSNNYGGLKSLQVIKDFKITL